MCCVRAGHVAEGVAARRHIIRPEERVLIIPVVVDRSNNSAFYVIAFGAVGVFIILKVLGLQIQIGSNRSFAPPYAKTFSRRSYCMMRKVYNFVGKYAREKITSATV